MIEVYVLDCGIEEISEKSFLDITNEEFMTFGLKYTLEEFEYGLNNPDMVELNLSNCWVRCIEKPQHSIEGLIGYYPQGFQIDVIAHSAIEVNKGVLLVNPKVINDYKVNEFNKNK